jgi:hypothetical protein
MSNDEMPPYREWVTVKLLERYKAAVQKLVDHCNEFKFTSIATDSIVTFVSHTSSRREPCTEKIQEACSMYHVKFSLETLSTLNAELTPGNFQQHLQRPEYAAFFASAAGPKKIPFPLFSEARQAYHALICRTS